MHVNLCALLALLALWHCNAFKSCARALSSTARMHISLLPHATSVHGKHVSTRLGLFKDEEVITALFEKARPSVVYISTLRTAFNPITFNTLEIPSQTGSGFVWDERHIVTNAHVLQAGRGGADLSAKSDETFLVTLLQGSPSPSHPPANPGRQSYRARIKGIDAAQDVAVLELLPSAPTPKSTPALTRSPPPPLPTLLPLQHGSSSLLRVGQAAIAIGNPFGLDLTLTTGVVSGLGRTVGLAPQQALYDMVQTDASINPGNSGGPLLDSSGRLIGMNTAIYTTSGTSGGIGFAIPVDTLKVLIHTHP